MSDKSLPISGEHLTTNYNTPDIEPVVYVSVAKNTLSVTTNKL